MKNPNSKGLILGLDIGTASVGWALIETEKDEPIRILRTGVRIFEAAVDNIAEIERGTDKSKAVARREARLRRRQLDRRTRRLKKLAIALQNARLLPEGDVANPEARKKYFDQLDKQLNDGKPDPAMLPYRLRAKALDEKLQPYELGRTLYHLSQKRGFKSGRKTEMKDDEKEKSIMKNQISDLSEKIKNSKSRTLGEYLSRLDPSKERLVGRYLDRSMIDSEFDKIWTTQSGFHPELLAEKAKKPIYKAIFFQRPLKSQKHTVGTCEYEQNCNRAPMALLISQRFRILQQVNNLRIDYIDKKTGEYVHKDLEQHDRDKLVIELEKLISLKFSKIRTLLDLKNYVKFNIENGGEEDLKGNSTAKRLIDIFGLNQWEQFPQEKKDRIVHTVRCVRQDEVLGKIGREKYGLSGEHEKKFGKLTLDDGYCSLSQRALIKLIPLMEQGLTYAAALKQVYGGVQTTEAQGFVPPFNYSGLPQATNPAVRRALSETRKIVNAIIREYGKPDTIRVELAREFKKTKKQRKEIWFNNLKRKKERALTEVKIIEKTPIKEPKYYDIEKVLLADECDWFCPYTGKKINWHSLFELPEFEVEHIIPLSRSFDNSFFNKTLCHVSVNRKKSNNIPSDAFDEKTLAEIIQRIHKWPMEYAKNEKLKRFQLKELEEIYDFANRQLNDTRYSSKLAVRYLGLLYGAGVQNVGADEKRHVEAARGNVTAHLRNAWGLNSILGDGGSKERKDHRHHAVDAVCIALTSQGMIKGLSDAVEDADRIGKFRRANLQIPWIDFYKEAQESIDGLIVSHRPNRKVNAALHDAEYYSKEHIDKDGNLFFCKKKSVNALTTGELNGIVDDKVRECVESRMKELGASSPKEAFKMNKYGECNYPYLISKNGDKIPIHSVRVRKKVPVTKIGGGTNERIVNTGSNHHVEIFKVHKDDINTEWEGRIVTSIEAMNRLRKRIPIIDKSHKSGEFLFSLSQGDTISLTENEIEGLYVVKSFWFETKSEKARIAYVGVNDARKSTGIDKKEKMEKKEPYISSLKKLNCRKMNVSHLGEMTPAND